MRPDFGLTAADYARHRAGFPASFYRRLADWGIGRSGQCIVDVGTGTGTLARGFAKRGCAVVGIDPAESMLAKARALCADEGLSVEYRRGRAEATGLAAGSVDVVAAGQCWHWFDRPRAAAEAARLLRPTGWLVIAHFDWIPLPGNLARATEELIEHHNADWRFGWGTGLYPRWLRDLGEASFREIESFSYDEVVRYTPAQWRGRIRASAGVGGTLAPEAVATFDAALGRMLGERFAAPLLEIPHRVFAVVARPPAQAAEGTALASDQGSE